MIALFAVLAACHSGERRSDSRIAGRLVREDTVDILEAVWRVEATGHSARRLTWLYLPSADTGALATSEDVRVALIHRGVPASARLPVGDDTVTFRVRRWTPESDSSTLLEVHSSLTTVLGSGRQRCRQRSGTAASYRALHVSHRWTANRAGPVEIGDSVCAPTP
ncbi:MAG: hypothetical protein M3P12_13640 [Gemmatimonadota bacterium]|nr:hypothetical protein [Gemmatimonadota bacterium]